MNIISRIKSIKPIAKINAKIVEFLYHWDDPDLKWDMPGFYWDMGIEKTTPPRMNTIKSTKPITKIK